jgi:hypothetical protein
VLRRDLSFRSSTATTKTLERRGMFRPGDLAIVAGNESVLPSSATCHLIEVTGTANPDNLTIDHVAGPYNSFYSAVPVNSRFNPAGGTGGVFANGRIYNLGPNPQRNIWTVRADGTLTRSDALHPGPPVDVAERVMNLKAEYGLDTDGDRRPDTWTTVAPVDWTTLIAVRTAILVRSRQYEATVDPNTNTPFPGDADGAEPMLGRLRRGASLRHDQRGRLGGCVQRRGTQREQLALLPLSRLRAGHPDPQHVLGDGAMSGSRTLAFRRSRAGQDGIVMWVALVVLIVMSLAGLAMMRQMGTGVSVAGNVAFKQNATSTAMPAPRPLASGP